MFPSHSLVVLLCPLVFLYSVTQFMPLVVLGNMDAPGSNHPLPLWRANIRTSRGGVFWLANSEVSALSRR